MARAADAHSIRRDSAANNLNGRAFRLWWIREAKNINMLTVTVAKWSEATVL
jgi:hypothetical protein